MGPQTLRINLSVPGGISTLHCLGRVVLLAISPSASIFQLRGNLRVLKGRMTLEPEPPPGHLPRVDSQTQSVCMLWLSQNCHLARTIPQGICKLKQELAINSHLSKIRSFYKFLMKKGCMVAHIPLKLRLCISL